MSSSTPRAGGPDNDRTVLRSVQRTGVSSLAVTLPKGWTEAFNVRTGSLLKFQDLGEGRLEVSLAGHAPDTGTRTLELDATHSAGPLLARLLLGAYITGQDRIVIGSAEDLPAECREEVARVCQRVLGMSVIEDEPRHLEIQIFLDPTKHWLPNLVDRVVRMLRLELEVCERALRTADPFAFRQIPQVLEEVDRFYLLIARQILSASNDFQVARGVGVPSHHYLIGYRVVVKMLEVIGGLVGKVAAELSQDLPRGQDATELHELVDRFDALLVRTMDAFREVSAADASAALTDIDAWRAEEAQLAGALIGRTRDRAGAARHQRILSSLGTATEMLGVVNEITINRSVEPETVARSGGRPLPARAAEAESDDGPLAGSGRPSVVSSRRGSA